MIPQETIDAEKRASAYQSTYAKTEEASKALRQEKVHGMRTEENKTPVFGDDDDDEDLRKSLATARKIASKNESKRKIMCGVTTCKEAAAREENPGSGDQPRNRAVVFTEMEEFVWGLQLDEGSTKDNVFISDQETKDEDVKEEEKEVVPDVTIHEAAVGKGLSGALKLLKGRGILNETIEWGGRDMDKKKRKLVGIYDKDIAVEEKEIRIDRRDEYGRILTPKEAFRRQSRVFHGKGPGKNKQEKHQRQYQKELKVKQMENSDTPSLSAKRMREAQAKLQTPYLVLSGNVKPGQCR